MTTLLLVILCRRRFSFILSLRSGCYLPIILGFASAGNWVYIYIYIYDLIFIPIL